jgi:Flp pilus assembly protein TadG
LGLNKTFGSVVRALRECRGAVSPLMALMLVPLIGMIGYAVEGGSLYFQQRSMQNAADSAAIAAASNNCLVSSCGVTYDREARAVATKFGYTQGTANTTVTPAALVTCPDGTSNCFKVTISKPVPISLLKTVGFSGNDANGQIVQASAVARRRSSGTGYCLIALASGLNTNSNAITMNGGNSVNLGGCSTFSNASTKCNGANGHDGYNIEYGYSVGSAGNNACGITAVGGVAALADPYSSLKSNIPANTCGTPGADTTISGNVNWSAYTAASPLKICGNLRLTGNVTISAASPGSVVVIEKGSLNLNGFTLNSPASSGLTFVFSGLNTTSVGFVTGSGTLDIAAPTTGVWGGVALYQNPNLTTTTSWSYSGNTPAFKVTGLVYMPFATITVSGAINKKTAGYACMAIVARQMTISGGGYIFADPTSECDRAGLVIPGVPGTGGRQALVL